ncbi:MAG: RluA family pseudouridine synthase [Flavobacteriaceae bacterium]
MSRIVTNASNIQLLYEDNHLIAVNKRIGDIIQGDKTKDKPLSEILKGYIKHKYNKPGAVFLGVTHRIDRPTSGIVVFAKTSKALKRMNQLFQEKCIHKIYWAIVKNKPIKSEDTLIHWLKKNPKKNTTKAFPKEVKDSKKAILHYKVIKELKTYSHLEVILETGRSHQIRSQLAYIGSPIKGDLKYGFDRTNKNGGIHLHAKYIEFTHPVSKKMIKIEANPPTDILWDKCS